MFNQPVTDMLPSWTMSRLQCLFTLFIFGHVDVGFKVGSIDNNKVRVVQNRRVDRDDILNCSDLECPTFRTSSQALHLNTGASTQPHKGQAAYSEPVLVRKVAQTMKRVL